MSTNKIQDGKTIEYTNDTGATITSGSVVLINKRIGVATADIADGAVGILEVEGVFLLPKTSSDTVTQGALLYWDNTNKTLTTTETDNTLAGYAFADAGNGTTTVKIKING